jgi:AraC-like DNA-binding protein
VTKTIGEIGLGAGFADHAHFSRSFRARFGQTPTEYRRALA